MQIVSQQGVCIRTLSYDGAYLMDTIDFNSKDDTFQTKRV